MPHVSVYAALSSYMNMMHSVPTIDDMKYLAPLFKRFTSEPVHNYFHLLNQSYSGSICFYSTTALGFSSRLDHYSTGIPIDDWRSFSKFLLDTYNVSSTIRNSQKAQLEQNIVLTLIERQSRKILNLAALRNATIQMYGNSLVVQMIDFSSMSFRSQLEYMRNTTILLA